MSNYAGKLIRKRYQGDQLTESVQSDFRLVAAVLIITAFVWPAGSALALPLTPETSKYLVIATGEGTQGDDFESFNQSNVEIGADQEVVSNSSVGAPSQRVGTYTGGLDLTGTYVPNDGENAAPSRNRWNDVDPDHSGDTVGVPDRLPGARPVFEGIDFSGNVALTGSRATFNSSNSDVNANIGIQCNRSPAGCLPSPSDNNTYFAPGDPNNGLDLNALNGVSQFDPTNLVLELGSLRDFIISLPSDTTLNAGYVNQNIKDSGAPVLTDLDAIDTGGNADGFAVFDVDVDGNTFELNNTDWILQSTMDTIAIFRMADGTDFNFSNSSILLGDGDPDSTDVISDLGAIFFMDAFMGTNELFNLSNVILGGIGLWDFTDFNPDRDSLLNQAASVFLPPVGDATVINLQDSQGCAQFISHQVLMSDNRWNRCALTQTTTTVPEPGALGLFLFGLIAAAVALRRPKRNGKLWNQL